MILLSLKWLFQGYNITANEMLHNSKFSQKQNMYYVKQIHFLTTL